MKTAKPIQITFARNVFEDIQITVGKLPAETGGLLGGDPKRGLVTHFHFDDRGKCSTASYTPDTATLNKLLDEWNVGGVRMLGFVHSHPGGFDRPSVGDEVYAQKILAANSELPFLVLPIVLPSSGNEEPRFNLFVAERNGNGIKISPAKYDIGPPPITAERIANSIKKLFKISGGPIDVELFSRVLDSYDLDQLQRCRVVIVGVGGAAAFGEDLARAGVGEFILIDPGLVEGANVCTQHYFLPDVGLPKVRCLAKRLKAVNPRVKVASFVKKLDDIDDAKFERLAFAPISKLRLTAFSPLPPRLTVIVGATDDFFAQARVNRLALKFNLPSVCAQNYKGAYAAEVTFTHPETTHCCHRCILSSRYDAYLNRKYQNTIGSAGSPISSTGRLNELKFIVTMAILHHGTRHRRWGDLLERIGDRNLIQVRNHPDVEQELGLANFSQAFAGATSGQIFFGETIWRHQVREHPDTGSEFACPDCGGMGDLKRVKGAMADTRKIPR